MVNSGKCGTVMAVADSGAMSNLWGLKEFLDHGFSTDDLIPVTIDIKAANKINLNILGYVNANISGQSTCGQVISCCEKVYVSDNVQDCYLSFDTMLDLGILSRDFPSVGQFSQEQLATNHATLSTGEDKTGYGTACKSTGTGYTPRLSDTDDTDSARTGMGNTHMGDTDTGNACNCPKRGPVPPRPEQLPFAPIPENNDRMRDWLLDRFKSSTFNTCPHCPLPTMTGPPIEMHVDESAKPKACHTAAPVALHWQSQVHKDLLRDEALGVIERVPYGEPVTWCHRMVVTRKHDGSPRRTVDLSPLNKFCKRETFSAEAPFPLARRVPGKTWKTVMDAWNGYHSVPLREEDRHLTTFITPFGRWRYTRAPQGYVSSGDGYNRRVDAILSGFERKERCVDDVVFHDEDLESHWWRAIDFLITCGRAGIVINGKPNKFQFAQREVNFAGFRITEDKILPLPKYIEAIKAFPTPTSTTDIRSWFGLINRVANYAKLREAMRLFKPFLSPKCQFFWSDVLEKAFKDSKEYIIDSILEGVEIFDVAKPTCLRPDWSKKGIGYLLLQKHCCCASEIPDCCDNGWKITLAGSRFLKGPEERYAAIEGEALAIVWGLEQTKYFTQGSPNLTVVTDHKPLVKIFGDRTLDEVTNPRLFRLKQKTLPWFFKIEHMPGKTNSAADAMSRYPALTTNQMDEAKDEESLLVSGICRDLTNISTISWENLAHETSRDKKLSVLIAHLTGLVDDTHVSTEYRKYTNSLYVHEGVILYLDRVVVPTSLRAIALENLHAAHQGVSSMESRASSIMFWPGMTEDICRTRASCSDCNINAPSQPPLPSSPAIPPSTPFEKVFADFFDFAGHHYLIVGDRLSGWPEVYSTPKGSSQAGSNGLIACLRALFATFGVPEELSSDRGPEFSANDTSVFLKKWGVHHRTSSAYFPQSNGRAEVAVKSAKRLLRSNIDASGNLNSDKFLRAMLQLRNTPDPDCNVSPAQIVFGRPLKDAFSFINRLDKFKNQAINPIWRDAWQLKEQALRTRFIKSSEILNRHSRNLRPLSIGDRVFVQNQTGSSPNKWDRTGIIMETNAHDQYTIRIDGSGRLTTRNRKFLRQFQPASMAIQPAPTANIPTTNQTTANPHNSIDIEREAPLHRELPTENITTEDDHQCHTVIETPEPVTTIDSVKPHNGLDGKGQLALRRIRDYNTEGLKENTPTVVEGRRLRNRIIPNVP